MLISEDTRNTMIGLVTATFQMNSFCDNIAYNLDAADLPNVSDIFHHQFAHKFPELADIITDLMARMDTRAVRGALTEDSENYDGNIVAMFADVAKECENYRSLIIKTIELAELNEDYEVKISMEEFLIVFMPLYKQARVWSKYAKRYEDDVKSFDVHFEDFTVYLEAVK